MIRITRPVSRRELENARNRHLYFAVACLVLWLILTAPFSPVQIFLVRSLQFCFDTSDTCRETASSLLGMSW